MGTGMTDVTWPHLVGQKHEEASGQAGGPAFARSQTEDIAGRTVLNARGGTVGRCLSCICNDGGKEPQEDCMEVGGARCRVGTETVRSFEGV